MFWPWKFSILFAGTSAFLNRVKKLLLHLITIYTTYSWPKMEYNSPVKVSCTFWGFSTALKRNRRCSLMTVRYPIPLIHWSVFIMWFMFLIYRYYYGFRFSEIKPLVIEKHVFLSSTRLSIRARALVVAKPVNRTLHYKQNSFFRRTLRIWNSLLAKVFPATCSIKRFKSNAHNTINSVLLSITDFSNSNTMHYMSRDHTLSVGLINNTSITILVYSVFFIKITT